MMRTIEVELPPWSELAFNSPDDAIADAKKRRNRTRRGESLAPYGGQSINSVQCRDDAFRLHLADGTVLQFGVVQHSIDVTIVTTAPDPHWGRAKGDDAILVFRGKAVDWRSRELIDSLRGSEFRGVQCGRGCVAFLYVSNVEILYLSIAIDRATSQPFLCWASSI